MDINENKELLQKIQEYLRKKFQDTIEKIILFGSRVEGNARDYSDYDLLIIIKGNYDWLQKDEILEVICELNLKYDIIIDAHIISTNDLKTIRGKQPFIQHAIETGLTAWHFWKEERRILIEHRLQKSLDAENEAFLLFNNKMYSAAINRIYYGMYHALTALALLYEFETTKHSRLIGWFNKTFIKSDLIEIKYAKILTKAFEKRMDSDYQDFVEFSADEIKKMIVELNEFTKRITGFITNR